MASDDKLLLEVRGLSRAFGSVLALQDVNFDLRQGEIHALMGENGAGKSTLVKALSGILTPDQGQIRISGNLTELANPRVAAAAGISTVHQELLLFADLSVAENIFSGHYPRTRWNTVDWNAMRKQSRALLAELDCHDLDVDAKLASLSVAMRQRCEIARALHQNAQVLILDEPTAALSEQDSERLLALITRLKSRGTGIVYVSHRMNEILAIADRMTVLRDGQLIGTLEKEAATAQQLITMMVGREINEVFPKVTSDIGKPMLAVNKLCRGKRVVDVSFTVRAGEILGVAGLVGSGRTELAHVLFGITPAESGSISVEGRTVSIKSPRDARDAGIAYVPEDRGNQGLIKPMLIRENLSMAMLDKLSPQGFINRAAERQVANDGFNRLGVRAAGVEQVAAELSGGNQQKVVLAKWLVTEPRILILDEPTRGIDVGAKAEIHKLMGQMAQAGLAVIMISSELPEVLAMSDRIMIISQGRISAILDAADASAEAVGHMMTHSADDAIDASNRQTDQTF